MSKKAKSCLLKYGISVLVCIGIGIGYIADKDFTNLPLMEQYRILSDAFFLPAYIFLASGIMVWLSNQGALDAVGYLMVSVVRFLIPGGALRREKYGDYVARRREKNVSGFGFLFFVGLACLVGAIVFRELYFQLHGPL